MFILIASLALQLQNMTVKEKIGQLFVVPACPLRGEDHLEDLQYLIDNYHIGGILLKQGDTASTVALLNKLPKDLLRIADAEWGVGMRVSDAVKFPKNNILGTVDDPLLLTRFGRQVGKECALLGIDMNLAPVADVNSNPLNPVIGTRSFGNNPELVALCACRVASAMQEEGIIATAKHFPGHGDTLVDSHYDLPMLYKMELLPFEALVKTGIKAIMTAHLFYAPAKEIVTFSPGIVEGVLRKSWGFKGLIITDALNMGAVVGDEEAALKALLAGHDLLLYGDHVTEVVDEILQLMVPEAYLTILEAYQEGIVTDEMLDAHVLRILEAKKQHRPLEVPVLITDEALALKEEILKNAKL